MSQTYVLRPGDKKQICSELNYACPSERQSNYACPSERQSNYACPSERQSNYACPSERQSNYACPSERQSNYIYLKVSSSTPSQISTDELKLRYTGLLSVTTEQQLINQFLAPLFLGYFSLSQSSSPTVSQHDFGNISSQITITHGRLIIPLLSIIKNIARQVPNLSVSTAFLNLGIQTCEPIDTNTGKPLNASKIANKLLLTNLGVPTSFQQITLPKSTIPLTLQVFVFRTTSVGNLIPSGEFIIGFILITDFYGETSRYYVIIDAQTNQVITQFGESSIRFLFTQSNCQTLVDYACPSERKSNYTPPENNTNLGEISVIPPAPLIETVSRSGDIITITGTGLTNITNALVGNIAGQILSVTDNVVTIQAFSPSNDVDIITLFGSASGSSDTSGTATPIAMRAGDNTITVIINKSNDESIVSVEVLGKKQSTTTISKNPLQYTFQAPAYSGNEKTVNITTTTKKEGSTQKQITYKTPLTYGPFIETITPSGIPGGQITLTGVALNQGTNPIVCFSAAETPTTPPLDVCTTGTVQGENVVVTLPQGFGTVDVTLTNNFGTSPPIKFTYLTPIITAITPNPGTLDSTFTLTGSNLTQGTITVRFGSALAQNIVALPNGQVQGTIPAGSGMVQVTLTNDFGTSPGIDFFYATPVITDISPNPGLAGNLFTLTGTNLVPGTQDTIIVKFGTATVTNVITLPDGRVQGTIPNGTGTVQVTLTNKFGTSPPVSFTYR